jgi:hypothetical protein
LAGTFQLTIGGFRDKKVSKLDMYQRTKRGVEVLVWTDMLKGF